LEIIVAGTEHQAAAQEPGKANREVLVTQVVEKFIERFHLTSTDSIADLEVRDTFELVEELCKVAGYAKPQ